MKSKFILRSVGLMAVFLFVFILIRAFSQASAQSETQRPPKVEAFMQRVLADQEPPHNLAPMAYTPCVGGMAGAYPCNNIDLLSFIPLATFGAGSGNSLWGWTDSLDGKEYALMGLNTGVGFVDISDPVNPVYLGRLPTHSANSLWRDVRVYNNHAFVISEASGHGMQIFDLTRLRNVVNPPVTFTEDAFYGQVSSTHSLAINEDTGYAYLAGSNTCSGGLHMVNIQTPTSPVFAGCFSSDGYTHEVQCWVYNGPDTPYVGHEICFANNEDTLTIVDVTNKAAPVQLSRTPYTGSSYTHQSWLTDDHSRLLLNDELDESNFGHHTRTWIWNVSDLNAPGSPTFHDGPTEAIDHNLYIIGNYAYEANYRAGLYILDISDIENGNLTEQAYFDIYPTSDSANFNGAWNNYPFFASGVVIVSGIEQGLFVLQPTGLIPDFTMSATPTEQTVCLPDSAVYDINIGSAQGFTETVTLSVENVPAGYEGIWGDTQVIPPATAVLTVSNTGAATLGTYDISVIGVATTATHTTTVQLTLEDVPETAVLTTPTDGATSIPLRPTLTWTAASGADYYILEVATDAAFTNIFYDAPLGVTSHTLPTDATLDPSTEYFWRVRAFNGCGETAVSPFSFTTIAAPDVVLSSDATTDGFLGTTVTYTLSITNTGTATDTFELTANSTWTTTFSTISVTLGVSESVDVQVWVVIPTNAADLETNITTVTATSQTDGLVTDSAVFTTTAHFYVIYLPVSLKN